MKFSYVTVKNWWNFAKTLPNMAKFEVVYGTNLKIFFSSHFWQGFKVRNLNPIPKSEHDLKNSFALVFKSNHQIMIFNFYSNIDLWGFKIRQNAVTSFVDDPYTKYLYARYYKRNLMNNPSDFLIQKGNHEV